MAIIACVLCLGQLPFLCIYQSPEPFICFLRFLKNCGRNVPIIRPHHKRLLPGAYAGWQTVQKILQESNPLRALPLQTAAPRPPEHLVLRNISFPMGHKGPLNAAAPETVHQLKCGNIPPGHIDVALITALVKNHRLLIPLLPFRRLMHTIRLNAAMRHIGAGEIVKMETVMIAQQMLIAVIGSDKFLYLIPILHRTVEHQIIFICQAPPDKGIGGQSPEQVIQVNFPFLHTHYGKAPTVIRMEQNQVRFYSHISQPDQDFFKMLPVVHAGAVHIPLPFRIFFKREKLRLIVIVSVMLRKNAMAHFIKGGVLQGVHGLFNYLLALVGKGVNGGSERQVFRTVFINKMKALCLYHTMSSGPCRQAFFFPCHRSFQGNIAFGFPGIQAGFFGEETYFISIASCVEAFYGLFFAVQMEYGLESEQRLGALGRFAGEA